MSQRTSWPVANSTDGQAYVAMIWDPPGGQPGSGGLYPALYPRYVGNGRVFVCPSARDYMFNNVASTHGSYADFGLAEQNFFNGQFWQFWGSYVGAVYGQLSSRMSDRGHSYPWDGYFIEGFWPSGSTYEVYKHQISPRGAMMWDIGTYNFIFGPGHGLIPAALQGAHRVGGHTLFVDGSVSWRSYPWIAQ
jgi:hypothetical protein